MTKHVLRNELIPTVTILAVNIGWLVSGAVVVETCSPSRAGDRCWCAPWCRGDYPAIHGLTLVFGILVIVVNLLADLSYTVIDRRVVNA